MAAAFVWGRKEGIITGAQETWGVVMDAFDAMHCDWDQEDNELIFTNEYGKKLNSSRAWDNAIYEEPSDISSD
tara:strand:+ start:234 stop:452 length:219 start_codon:yes stop_codon:yes gene_type:complete